MNETLRSVPYFKRGDCVVDIGKRGCVNQDDKVITGVEINFGRGVVLEGSSRVLAVGEEPTVLVYFDNYKLGPIRFSEADIRLDSSDNQWRNNANKTC